MTHTHTHTRNVHAALATHKDIFSLFKERFRVTEGNKMSRTKTGRCRTNGRKSRAK